MSDRVAGTVRGDEIRIDVEEEFDFRLAPSIACAHSTDGFPSMHPFHPDLIATSDYSSAIPAAWPRGMTEAIAASYIGLSRSTFRRQVKLGTIPAPTPLTPGRQVWLREELDAYLNRAAGKPCNADCDSTWMEAFNGLH